MALQMSLRRGASTLRIPNVAFNSVGSEALGRRYKSSDVGDVIGIDLGTTNSCVAIMVSSKMSMDLFFVLHVKCAFIEKNGKLRW
jgi:hypothetical protein